MLRVGTHPSPLCGVQGSRRRKHGIDLGAHPIATRSVAGCVPTRSVGTIKAISDQVDPQDLDRQQRDRQPEERCQKNRPDFGRVGGYAVADEFADIVVETAAMAHCMHDGGEVVVEQHHVCRFGAFLAHRHADDHRHHQIGQHRENAARHVYDTEHDRWRDSARRSAPSAALFAALAEQGSEQFHRQREDDGVALVAGNGIEGLQVAELHGLRRLRQHLRSLEQFFGSL